jgi:hypothetical protein
MVTLSSLQGFLGAIRGAKDIVFDTYVLQSRGEVFKALEAACRRGAHVVVRVAKDPYENQDGGRGNAGAVDALGALGADARVAQSTHMKGAVFDGVGFVDDCNWRQDGSDTILRDDSLDDVRMIRDAADGKIDPTTPSFAVKKDDALSKEKALLASAKPGEDVIVETESISFGSVTWELGTLAKEKHCHVRLIVNKHDLLKPGGFRETGVLNWLKKSGVDVRLTNATEKFAVVDREEWVGSANVSIEDARLRKSHTGMPDTIEWGMRTRNGAITAHLRDTFESRWGKAA